MFPSRLPGLFLFYQIAGLPEFIEDAGFHPAYRDCSFSTHMDVLIDFQGFEGFHPAYRD